MIPWERNCRGEKALRSRLWRLSFPGIPPSRHYPSSGRGAEWSPRRRKKPHRTGSWQSSSIRMTLLLMRRFLRHSGASALGSTVPSSPLALTLWKSRFRSGGVNTLDLKRTNALLFQRAAPVPGEGSIIGPPFRYIVCLFFSQSIGQFLLKSTQHSKKMLGRRERPWGNWYKFICLMKLLQLSQISLFPFN